jgi:hypothetical protein
MPGKRKRTPAKVYNLRSKAFREGFKAFKPYRDAEIAKYKRVHGHKPRGKKAVADYIKINKAAGRKYRAEN